MSELMKVGSVCLKTSNVKWQDQNGQAFEYIDLSSVSRDTHEISESTSVTKEDAPSRARKIVKTGDVIFATTRPTLKRVTAIPETYDNQICSTGYCVLRPDPSKVLTNYLFYALQSEEFMERMESLQRGASYPAVSDTDVKGFEIPIPPLPEQERIVAKLDTAKANTERNLQNAKELFQSKLNEVFSQQLTAGSTSSPTVPAPAVPEPVEGIEGMGDGWVEKKLGDVADLLNGYAFKSKEFVGSGVRLLRNTNVFHGNVDWENTAHYPNDALQEFSRFELFEGDIVLSLDRPIISTGLKLARVRKQDVPSLLLQRVLCIRPQGISADYVFHWMDSPLFISKIDPGKSLGVPHISLKEVSQIELPIPSLDKQTQIVGVLDEMKEQSTQIQTNYTQKLTELEDLKKSLLERAFKGEI